MEKAGGFRFPPPVAGVAADATLPHPHAFFGFVFEYSVTSMIQALMLRFELAVLGDAEVCVSLWYLEYLLDLRLQNRRASYRALPNKHSKKHNKPGAAHKRADAPPPPIPLTYDLMLVSGPDHPTT
jgi:hypothetical protein